MRGSGDSRLDLSLHFTTSPITTFYSLLLEEKEIGVGCDCRRVVGADGNGRLWMKDLVTPPESTTDTTLLTSQNGSAILGILEVNHIEFNLNLFPDECL